MSSRSASRSERRGIGEQELSSDALLRFQLVESIQPLPQLGRERHQPLFLALAEYFQHCVVEIDVAAAQVQHLRNPQTAIEDEDDGDVDAALAELLRR